MLSQLRIELESIGINYRKSSVLQGILFEQLSPEYIEKMHSQSMHPYSQYLTVEDGIPIWHVNTLNEEAHREIMLRLLSEEFTGFTISRDNMKVNIKSKEFRSIRVKDLLQDFYDGDVPKSIRIKVLTPMAFKQNGMYQVLPDVRCIFQNIMQKSSAASAQTELSDEDALETIVGNTYISRYKIRTIPFPLEGTVINGCVGDVTFGFKGSDIMRKYALFLLRYAEYAGIGIKTGMGMGGMKIIDWRTADE